MFVYFYRNKSIKLILVKATFLEETQEESASLGRQKLSYCMRILKIENE